MGDRSRFDDAAEIQKLSGLGLVACSSGKHKGETKISHRGRKRLRYWLFQAAKSAVAHSPEFKELHLYYTTRAENPLKKMQSLIVIACKILRIIFTILRDGTKYDPGKMLSDIRRQEKQAELTAAYTDDSRYMKMIPEPCRVCGIDGSRAGFWKGACKRWGFWKPHQQQDQWEPGAALRPPCNRHRGRGSWSV